VIVMLSPIEMMIDKAVGYDPARPGSQRSVVLPCRVNLARVREPNRSLSGVVMFCPRCRATKSSYRHRTDPKGTAVVCARCSECQQAEGLGEILYFDKHGRELWPS
jgi:hypothetical protein